MKNLSEYLTVISLVIVAGMAMVILGIDSKDIVQRMYAHQ